MCSPDEKILSKVKKLVLKKLQPPEQQKVLFLLPEALISLLKQIAAKAVNTTQTIRGYNVKSNLKPETDEKQEAKRKSILSVLWRLGRAKKEK
jgi:hypothetical protein